MRIAADLLAWWIALSAGTAMRYDLDLTRIDLPPLALLLVLAGVVQVASGLVTGLYLGKWRFGSFDEVAALIGSALGTTAVLFTIVALTSSPHLVPLGAVLAGGIGALVLTTGVRYISRLLMERWALDGAQRFHPTIVFGAGEGGYQTLTALRRDPSNPYLPVALLDDDPAKRRLRLQGIRVMGSRSRMEDVVAETGADTLIIAIPSAERTLLVDIHDHARALGLAVKVLPAVGELYGEVGTADIRDVTIQDLLGRQPVDTDIASIAGYLRGRRVLVTGAGGSIGSELCRQISRFSPASLVMLDRDESALHAVQLSIEGRALLDSPSLVLVDIRDRSALDAVFARHHPQVVFHAAALKHLTLLERHPAEAVKTNVWGTVNVLDIAAAYGVERLVNISSDKAADPISVLGYSKRVAERLTAGMGAADPFLSVRFGNVLNSRGSVLETFRAQVAAGGPITVTDPEAARYFMTIPEAVELVIQAGAIGRAGEALVLHMGNPVRIEDVARRMAEDSPRPISIVYTGLRPGEKCREVLFGTGEEDRRPVHSLIAHVPVPPLTPEALGELDLYTDPSLLVDSLRRLCVVAAGEVGLRSLQG
ncbi:MAG: polysaccharide biosynthesis protein [Acidimicrobiales bacterium]